MKRMVTYLYEYHNGIKGTGAGFLKLDSRGNDCRIQLYLQGRNAGEDHGMVYLVIKQEKTVGIPLGEVAIRQGTAGGSWVVNRESICGSPWSFSDVEGMAVMYPSGRYLAGRWIEESDEGFLRGKFDVWSDHDSQETLDHEEQPGQLKKSENQDDAARRKLQQKTIEEPLEEPLEEQPEPEEQLPVEAEQLTTAEINPPVIYTTERIDISDIRKFPKKNWHLCSNSFVIHGFFNYHYLVHIHREEEGESRQYLGIPGVYAKPERAMAMLFGFSEFVELQSGQEKQQKEETQEGTFGYWCCQLDV